MKNVAIIMGSGSDADVMGRGAQVLEEFAVPYEMRVVSAHRTPRYMYDFAVGARDEGFAVIIAGAGGAAHLPGMVASLTTLPVIGVPIKSSNSIQGLDSLLSIVQMPKGVPVATVAIDAASNAALLAIKILAVYDQELEKKLVSYQKAQEKLVRDFRF